MKKVTIALLTQILILISQSFSQKWEKGYIILIGGDTVQGYILRTWQDCQGPYSNSIDFKGANNSVAQTYFASKIKGFGIGRWDIYISTPVSEVKVTFPYAIPDSCIGKERDSDDVVNSLETSKSTVVNFNVAKFHLPPELCHYSSDTVFGHILVFTDFLRVFETFQGRRRFFSVTRLRGDRGYEYAELHVKVKNSLWIIPEYKRQLLDLLGTIRRISSKEKNNLKFMIAHAEYTEEDIPGIIAKIATADGGKIIYTHQHLGKLGTVTEKVFSGIRAENRPVISMDPEEQVDYENSESHKIGKILALMILKACIY